MAEGGGPVRDAVPERVDGWRNLARVRIAEGDTEAAIELLQEAERRAPGDDALQHGSASLSGSAGRRARRPSVIV